MDYLLVAAGLGLLLFGGELLVRGAVCLARRLGVSPLIIGLTIVAYGTSAPELLVSLEAALSGVPDIATGNVVGSNIANILLIVGCTALIYPITCSWSSIRQSGPVLLAATLVLVAVGLYGTVTAWAAAPMLLALVAMTVFGYRAERRKARSPDHVPEEVEGFEDGPQTLPKISLALIFGLGGVILGSHLLITGAVGLARTFGVSDATIGLTLVALGTSLPELATGAVAAYRRQSQVALGNVVGSNIFNILGIMGIVPLVRSLPVPAAMASFDLWVMLGATIVFLLLVAARPRIGRIAGGLLLLGYGVYIACHYFGLTGIPSAAI